MERDNTMPSTPITYFIMVTVCKESCGMVMFLAACVNNVVWWVSASLHGWMHHPCADTPPWADKPLGIKSPLGAKNPRKHKPPLPRTLTVQDGTYPHAMQSCYT